MRYRTLGLIAICLALSCGIGPAFGKSTTQTHKSFVVKQPLDLITVLESGDFNRCKDIISERGLTIVQAYWLRPGDKFYNQAERIGKQVNQVSPGTVDISDFVGVNWVENEVHLSRSQLRSKQARRTFRQFSDVLHSTEGGYPRSIMVSLKGGLAEYDQVRPFGLAINGKICAGSFWNIYYWKEHGKLKVWRIEFDYA